MAKVKCLVCGAVFEDGAEACPVCGVGPENFQPFEATGTTFNKDTDEKFVIIGGGPAAKNAAEAIRERNMTAMITIVSKEAYLPYNRPMLTKAIIEEYGYNGLAIEGEEWYTKNNVFFMSNTEVVSIDTNAKMVKVKLQDGSSGGVVYDKLIYALGAYCFVAPIKGAELDHVVTVRSIDDTKRVRKIIEERNATKAVCIGGGVMGLEGAWGLKAGDLDVTVLETSPGLLPRQLDDAASKMLEDICNSKGVHIVTNAKIKEITPNAVVMEDGTEYEAQLVIMSTGMRPYTQVAEESGIEVDRWVVANSKMETNVKDVYACGDACVVNGQPQAFWVQACETGRVAGANAAGEETEYEAIGSALVIDAFDTSLFSLGTNGKDPEREFRAVDKSANGNYEKYYFENDKLEGVILLGDISKMGDLMQKVADHTSYDEMFS